MGVWHFETRTIECFGTSLEKLEKRIVPVIPYSLLELDTRYDVCQKDEHRVIALIANFVLFLLLALHSRGYFAGASSRVYRGTYETNQVVLTLAKLYSSSTKH